MVKTPATITTILKQFGDSLYTHCSFLAESHQNLSGVNLPYVPGAVSSSAEPIGTQLALLEAMANGKFKVLTVHPWTAGLGESCAGKYTEQSRGYLSPANAVNFLSGKLKDTADPAEATALVVMVSAINLIAWITLLENLTAVFPVGDLKFCLNRAKALNKIEGEKFNQATPPINPVWREQSARGPEKLGGLLAAVEGAGSYVSGTGPDINPVLELQFFLSKRTTQATAAFGNAQALASLIAGGAGSAFILDAGFTIDNSDESHAYTAAVCLSGAAEYLQLLTEVFL